MRHLDFTIITIRYFIMISYLKIIPLGFSLVSSEALVVF